MFEFLFEHSIKKIKSLKFNSINKCAVSASLESEMVRGWCDSSGVGGRGEVQWWRSIIGNRDSKSRLDYNSIARLVKRQVLIFSPQI